MITGTSQASITLGLIYNHASWPGQPPHRIFYLLTKYLLQIIIGHDWHYNIGLETKRKKKTHLPAEAPLEWWSWGGNMVILNRQIENIVVSSDPLQYVDLL